jgi:5-methylcytosine-specific restriction protein B
MKAYIFQSVPDHFDLRNELHARQEYTWYATRYQNLMQTGDVVFFWLGGDTQIRGLYGWGKLISECYVKPGWDSHGVDVRCQRRFGRPILATDLRSDPVLSGMLILRAPQGTNFLLTDEQTSRLAALVSSAGEPAPNLD